MAAYLKRLFILSVCVVCLLSTNAFPQSNQIPIGARPAGLGDAFIAVADDGNALYWNPAGIATLGHHEFNGMTANAFQAGVKHQFLSYILPFSSRHALGIAGFSERLSDDEIDFGWNIYQLSYARNIFKNLSIGINVKYMDYSISLDDQSLDKPYGLGLDLGILYCYSRFKFGLSVQDIGDLRIKHDGGYRESVREQKISFGISYRSFFNILLASSITPGDRLHFGVEYWDLNNSVALRAGVQQDIYDMPISETIYSVGASLKFKIFQFDYAYSIYPTLHNNSRFSISLTYSFTRFKISIHEFIMNNLFASRHNDYNNLVIGKAVLENKEDEPVFAKIKLSVPGLIDEPVTIHERKPLRPHVKIPIEIKGIFLTEKALQISNDSEVQATLNVSYTRSDKEDYDKKGGKDTKFTLYTPGAVSWAIGPAAAASFITNTDPIIEYFANNTLNQFDNIIEEIRKNREHQTNFIKAAIIFDALGCLGISYKSDPYSPFFSVSKDSLSIDNIRYPGRTLQQGMRYGDCDDTSVLVASLFEAVNIETAVAMADGHLYLFFNSGVHPHSIEKLLIDSTLYLIKDDAAWIPVETTELGQPLNYAIKKGATNELLKFVKVHDAWNSYKPTRSNKPEKYIDPPATKDIRPLLEKDIKFIKDKGIDKDNLIQRFKSHRNDKKVLRQLVKFCIDEKKYNYAELIYQKLLKLGDNITENRFLLGVTYCKNNKFTKAINQADILVHDFPDEIHGYLLKSITLFDQNNYDKSIFWYNYAKGKKPESILLRKYNIPLKIESIRKK